jgi:thioredoxin reductase (NADPH)
VFALYDVIIIGSGPAGLTAAIYTGRARLETLVIAGVAFGGQPMLTEEVENFPGFPESIRGPELIDRMRKQAERFGAKFLFQDAAAVDFSSKPFKVKAGKQVFEAKSVIIATGGSPKWLGLESEARFRGRGVSSCAVCDGPLFKEKKVVVVGGGDTAVDETLTLAKFAKEVMLIHRRNELRATKILQDRAFSNKKISFVWDSVVEEILGKNRVEGIRIRNVKTGEKSEIATDGVFVAIGHKPNTAIFKGQIEFDNNGYVVVKDETKTSVEGVFVAGDVLDPRYRQVVTAAGSGCKAALDAVKYVEEHYS